MSKVEKILSLKIIILKVEILNLFMRKNFIEDNMED